MPETSELETLERRNIDFFSRPTVEEEDPEGLADVQSFYMVMSVHGEDRYRSCIGDPEDELGVELDPQEESASTAEIFNDLRLETSQQPVKPLLEGEWD